MTPPHLPADAPVLNVLQPLRVDLLPVHRVKPNQVFANNVERFLRLRIPQKPLLADPWLDWDFAAIAEADVVLIRLGFCQQPTLLQNFCGTLRAARRSSPCSSGTAGQLIRP